MTDRNCWKIRPQSWEKKVQSVIIGQHLDSNLTQMESKWGVWGLESHQTVAITYHQRCRWLSQRDPTQIAPPPIPPPYTHTPRHPGLLPCKPRLDSTPKLNLDAKACLLSWKLCGHRLQSTVHIEQIWEWESSLGAVELTGLSHSFPTPLCHSSLGEKYHCQSSLSFSFLGWWEACVTRSVHHACIHTAYAIYSQTD